MRRGGRFQRISVQRRLSGRLHDHLDRQTVLARELEVALIVRRHRHDRPRAVLGQHEVGDPDWHRFALERIQGEAARVEPFLLDLAGRPRGAIERPEAGEPRAERLRVGARRGEAVGQRMLGGQQHRRGAVDRIDPRREHLDGLGGTVRLGAGQDREPHQRAV